MNFSEYLDKILFSIVGIEVSLLMLLGVIVILALLFGLGFYLYKRVPIYFENGTLPPRLKKRTKWSIFISLVLMADIAIAFLLKQDFVLYQNTEKNLDFTLSTLFGIFLLLLLAHLADLLISTALSRNYTKQQKALKGAGVAEIDMKNMVRPIVYLLVVLFFIYKFDYLNAEFFAIDGSPFKLSNILMALLMFVSARLFIWILTKLILARYYRIKDINTGSRYAINQLVKYFIFTFAILAIIESLGIKLTLIWGGAAALMVGVGLGLQQTFNDLISGFILLFERTVELEDVVEFDDMIGVVKKIGVRTSLIETRDNITVIVPNSKLVGDYVINWSHYRERSRFKLKIGVAYGSDVHLVKEQLLKVIEGNDKVLQRPKPFVRFADFGDSSLDFELHFWSRHLMGIENVKSDMRFKVYELFNAHNIEIPFPQRDVWIKSKD